MNTITLTNFEILTGSFSLLIVIIYFIIGLKIVFKYIEFKQRVFVLMGLTWVFMGEIYWSSAISFVVALITGEGLSEVEYFFIGNLFIPLALVIWLAAFTEFKYKEKRKIIIIIAAIYGAIYEIAFMYYLFTDVSVIGQMFNAVDAEYRSFALIYLISVLLIFVITGLMFASSSLRSDNLEVRLKGKLIILAMLLFAIGAALDGLKPILFPDYIGLVLVINRIILISSAITFYIGFILPNWVKKLFLKE